MRVFGTGEACLVYQSGQEIGLVQEGACLCLPRLSRERKAAFCSREGLPRSSRERDGAFCSRSGLPRLSRERNSAICSREGLLLWPRATERCGSVALKTLGLVVGTLNVEEDETRPEKLLMPKVADGDSMSAT